MPNNFNLSFLQRYVFYIGRQPHMPIEPDVGFAYINDDGKLVIHSKSIGLHLHLYMIAPGLGVEPENWVMVQNPAGYDIASIRGMGRTVCTSHVRGSAFRGYGSPQSEFASEVLMAEITMAVARHGERRYGRSRGNSRKKHAAYRYRGTVVRGTLPVLHLLEERRILEDDIRRARRHTVAVSAMAGIEEEIRRMLLQIPAINGSLAKNELIIGTIYRIAGFAANHTIKRTIFDQRSTGEHNAAYT